MTNSCTKSISDDFPAPEPDCQKPVRQAADAVGDADQDREGGAPPPAHDHAEIF